MTQVAFLDGPSTEREQREAELVKSGVAVPAIQRSAWARVFGGCSSWFLAALDDSGRCQGAVTVDVTCSRALPKHLLLRVRRCGPARTDEAFRAVFAALANLAREDTRVLRLNVELFSTDRDFRAMAGQSLAALGFRPASQPRSYARTLAIDLSPSEEELLALLSQSTRRKIRAISKRGCEVRPISDPSLGNRMEAIRRATLERTGGTFRRRDWGGAIELCGEHPQMSRLVGLFHGDANTPESLLAFAWGLHNVNNAEYHTAASARDHNIKIPLGHALMWDLICWAKRHGAQWFDLGGVTPGRFGDGEDRLGGISDFKRSFGEVSIQVGEEWEWEPRPIRGKLARVTSRVAHLVVDRAFRSESIRGKTTQPPD